MTEAQVGHEAGGAQREEGQPMLRSKWLLRAAGGLGTFAAGAIAADLAVGNGSPTLSARDREVLRFALELEHLQAAFYTEVLTRDKLTGEFRQFAEIVGREEHAHLLYLEQMLGLKASASQAYQFGDAATDNTAFAAAAVVLEDTGLAAYNGQAENVSRRTLTSVARVISVEARHAAWARGLAGQIPAPHATDQPISAATAMASIKRYLA